MEDVRPKTYCCDINKSVWAARNRVAVINEAIITAYMDDTIPMEKKFASDVLNKNSEFLISLKKYDCEH